jgi:ABC-type proline/glycine betaine transport system permease subunit
MNTSVAEAWALLPDYLGQHVILSVSALSLGVAISLPLGVLAARNRRFGGPLLVAVSIVQTVPGLALLALFYPLLLALSALSLDVFGVGFRALGFLPALCALTLYAMLPILRNVVTALQGLDPAVLMAAKGVGMTPRQSLFKVELPLAAPIILAGIRTATVWVVGITTLSTPIGQTSLGNYIFTGLQIENWVFVLFGCVAAAVLAMVLDLLWALAGHGLTLHSRPRLVLAAGTDPGDRRGAGPRNDIAATAWHRDRSQEFRRAIYPGQADGIAAGPGRLRGQRKGRSGFDHRVPGADRGRYRCLCRLFRHAVGQHPASRRHAGPRSDAKTDRGLDVSALWNFKPGFAGLRERLHFRHARRPRQGAWHPQPG